MEYNTIYSRFLSRTNPQKLLSLSLDDFNEIMCDYLHNAVSQPMIRKLFSSLSLDDEVQTLSYVLSDSIDDDSDEEFVTDILTQAIVIQWMRHQIDTDMSLAMMIGGKEEKMLKNDLSTNITRVNSLDHKLERSIRNHGYYHGSYSTG